MAKSSKPGNNTAGYNLNDILYTVFFLILPLVSVPSLIDYTLTPRQLYLSVFLVLAVILNIKHLNKPQKMPLVYFFFAGFLAINLISFTSSVNPVESYAVFSKYGLVFTYFLTTWIFLKQKVLNKEVIIKSIIFFGGVASVITLFQIIEALGNDSFFTDIYSVKGTFSHKNLLSSALMLSLPFTFMGVAFYKGLMQKLSWAVLFLIVAEIFILRTRGVWGATFIATFITLIVFYIYNRKRATRFNFPYRILGFAMALALAILALFFSNSTIQSNITDASNITKRVRFWNSSIKMIKENPLIGVGTGNWKLHFPKYGISGIDESVSQGITHLQRPHNDFLWIWAESGSLALIFYLGIFVLALVKIRFNLKVNPSREIMVINLSALFGIVSYVIFSLGDFPMERISHNVLLYTLIALIFLQPGGKLLKTGRIPFHLTIILTVFSLVVCYYRFTGEQKAVKVLEANANRNAQAIIPAVEEAENDFYNMDSYSNPLRYYSSLGYLATKKTDMALADIEVAKKYAPYNILIMNQLGNVHKMQGELDKAVLYFDSALAISPHFAMAVLNKGEILLSQNKFLEAYATLSYVKPSNSDPRYILLMARALRGGLKDHKPEYGYNKVFSYFKGKNPQQPEDYIKIYREAHRELNAKLKTAKPSQ